MRSLTRCKPLALCLLLGGCGTLLQPSWSLYSPEVYEPLLYHADRYACQKYALAYITPLDPIAIALSLINGAANQPQSVESAGIGAGAGTINSLAEAAGLSHADERAVYVECAKQKTQADHSALVLDQH